MVISADKPQRVVITLVLSLDDYLLKKNRVFTSNFAIPVGYEEGVVGKRISFGRNQTNLVWNMYY